MESIVATFTGDFVTQSSFYTRDPNLLRRNEIYLQILSRGILRIRGAGYNGDHQFCEIEADHLHNIPSYIAGGDAANHLYYLAKEVPFYLSKMDLKISACREVVNFYTPLWMELESLVPIADSPWQREWIAMKANGWNYGQPRQTTG